MKRFALSTSVLLALASSGAALAAGDTVTNQPIQLTQTKQPDGTTSGSGAATTGSSAGAQTSEPSATTSGSTKSSTQSSGAAGTTSTSGTATTGSSAGSQTTEPSATTAGSTKSSTQPSGATGTTSGTETNTSGTTTAPAASQPTGTAGTTEPTAMDKAKTADTRMDNPLYQRRAEEIIGKDVVNAEGDEVGEIDDLVLDQENKVVYAIVSAGGFLGIGEKKVAVNFDELSMVGEDEIRISDQAAARLKDAPAYNKELGYQPVARDRPLLPEGGTQ